MTFVRSPDKDLKLRLRSRALWGLFVLSACTGCVAGSGFRRGANRPIAAQPIVASAAAPVTLAEAQRLDRLGDQRAVDLYFQAAIQASQDLAPCQAVAGGGSCATVYQQALCGLIDAGQRYGRLDPRRHLIVVEAGTCAVPVRYFGFAWRPDDFSRLVSVEGQTSRDIAHHYATPGLGLPLVGERIAACPQETFFRPWQPFAVTAVLRPATDAGDPAASMPHGGHVLELYNPLVFDSVAWRGVPSPLARDLTAPLAAIVNEAPRQYLRGFTAPSDTSVQPQLVMTEPYQRGKIPVVFIHGLYSDPITWVDMANELRAQRDLYDQFQFWTFRYPTGADVLASAAALRRQLRLARDSFDCRHDDAAMDEMVLVGHSLGGLVSKMQVAVSYDLLWREVAWQPFDAVRASPELQSRLAQGFFFEPLPMVKRVVFIGTPHRGSGMTRRLAGRIGSALVRVSAEENAEFHQLLDDNPDVFKPFLRRQRPTSIALLDPDSPFLAALQQMPVNCQTRLHSIIGTGGNNLLGETGDGLVSISSAQHYGDSELFVPAKHEKLHRHPASICEVGRILRLHAAE
jgi:pimeloyl-ACP methyl ester carboxylesterase